MNAWLSLRPDERLAQGLRAVLRRGTRMSHHLFSIVGGSAILLAVALWLMPTWRGTLAARLMPVISAAVQAGPARLLQGNPLPAFGPPGASSDDSLSANSAGNDAVGGANSGASVSNTSYDGAFDGSGTSGMGVAALNGLDPRTMQSVS